MAPTRKEVYEKNAWLWVDTCQPLAISDEHVRTAYRINLSRCKIGACRRNCKGNPFCLSNLGEQRWLGSHEDSYCDHVIDPEKERRKPGTYVGLKNLGATCYVNSLLQLWFHNLNFRKAIFKWDPLEDPEEKQNVTITEEKYVPLSVLGHLQAVFAVMRYGERRFVDPTDFILSLRLDTSIQQDAQEFSKLFLSKLETTLSYQPAKEVRDLIKDNFCGEYSYVTRCMKCKMESKRPSTFYELDLNIKGHKTIQDCLREFMNIEMLEGDDKYFCQLCGMKQDAQRFISLTELPPVLNLQLMRFVFDKNTGYKKKLNTFVQFPDKLNMSEFCPNVKGNMEYNLSAVLVHGGRSANSGHYVAHICDSESSTWYKFNDESVEKIEGKKLKLGTEDEYEDGGKKMKIPRAPKGSYHSPNAYMLVYTRSDVVSTSTPLRDETCGKEIAANDDDDEWILPSHLQNFVHDHNLQFEKWVTEVQKTNDMAVGRNHHQQLEMATNITLLSIESGYDNLEAVPTSWLTRWLSDPDLDSVIENEKYACCHGKLNPNEVSNVKYINSEMADKLFDKYGGEPRFKYSDFLCQNCVIAKYLKIRVKNQIQNEFKVISNKLKTKFCESEIGYWVGKLSLRSWRRMALENLENGVLDRKRIESLLNGAEMKPGKGASGAIAAATAAAGATSSVTILCKNEENETTRTEKKQMIVALNNRAKTSYETRQSHATNGQTDYEKAGTRVGDGQTEREPKPRPKHRSGGDDNPNANAYECERRCSPRFLVLSKLEECCSVSDANKNDPVLRELCEPLKNVLGRVKNICDGARCEQETTPMTKTSASSTSTSLSVSSYNGAYHSFLQNRDKTLQTQTSSADGNNVVDERSTKPVEGKSNDGSVFSESGGGGDGDGVDEHGRHQRHHHRRRRRRGCGRNDNGYNAEFGCYYDNDDVDDDGDDDDDDEDVNGGDVEDDDDDDDDDYVNNDYDHDKNFGGHEGDRDDDDDDDDDGSGENNDECDDNVNDMDEENRMERRKKPSLRLRRRHQRASCQRPRRRDSQLRQEVTSYSACAIENGNDDRNANNAIEVPAATATMASSSHRIVDLPTRLNGDATSTATFRTKCVVDDEDDSSYAETKFNDDLLCLHGNLCAEENSRKLVPEQVWRLLKKYFPYANEFTSLSQPCGLCKSIASEAEVAKDMYKTGAVMQKEVLGDLYADRCRPQLVYRHAVDADVENVFYLINIEFINSWRKFIRENGKREPPYSIKNQSWLLCADHSGLLYDLNDLNQRMPNTFVVITRLEWQLLCEVYNADCEISVKCMPNGTVVTHPDVCVPCMRRRIEIEEKAQLCYSKAKIYIKVQNDEEVDYLSNEEVTAKPPAAKRAKILSHNGSGSGSGSGSASSSSSINMINGNHGNPHHTNGSGSGSVGIAAAAATSVGGGSNGFDYASGNGDGAGAGGESNHLATNNWCVSVDDSRSNSVAAAYRHSASSLTSATSSLTSATITATATSTATSCRNETTHGVAAAAADAATTATATASTAVTAVRRSSRCRRVRGVKEMIVSSDLTLLDVKKKICEMMSVAPMDQHLFTSDGRSLTENAATLTELCIHPESVLNLKVDEPCESVTADEFIIDREPEAGFKGTGLVGS